MDTSSLRKVLDLEHRKGYADTAVIGGLDRFMRNWVQTAASTANKKALTRLKALANPGYSRMTVPQRVDWAHSVLALVVELETGKSITSPIRLAGKTEKPPKSSPVSAKRQSYSPASIDQPVTAVKGIGPNLAPKLAKLGVRTIRDLLYFFPNRHVDYSKLKSVSQLSEGTEETIIANVWEAQESYLGGRESSEAIVGDATGNVRAVWFNNPYVAKSLKSNTRIVLSGRVRLFNGRFVFESPEWEPAEEGDLVHTGRLVPIYPLTEGLSQRQVRRLVKGAVDRWAESVTDFLPDTIKNSR